jgi:hypothetical protein
MKISFYGRLADILGPEMEVELAGSRSSSLASRFP